MRLPLRPQEREVEGARVMRTLVFAFSLITLAGVARAQTPPSQPPLSVAQQPAGTAAESQGLRALDPNWVIVLLTIVLAWLANEDRRLNHRMCLLYTSPSPR